MSPTTSYGPIGESPAELLLERTFMQAGYLTGFGYGFQLALWMACMRILWRRVQKATPGKKSALYLMVYITILCIIDTIWTAVSTFGLQATFIDNRNYPAPDPASPGGPIAYLQVEFSQSFNIVAQVVFTLGSLMTDALLIWRCKVIWAANPVRSGSTLVIIFPIVMFFASLAFGVVFGIQTASPEGLFSQKTASFAVPFFAISLSLNIILTLLILGRIWYYQKRVNSVLEIEYSKPYSLLSMMFVESAALNSIISILLLVTFALGHPINQIWLGLTPATQKIASYLIIYRVAQNKGWAFSTTRQSRPAVSMAFAATSDELDTHTSRGVTDTDMSLQILTLDGKSSRNASIQREF
ncbi:hypothetical protein E1B28_000721 [Marasmius oreades]|uniref:Uncharacterized protein n=1 Tax=Marasmius oreades TaxID=181124 RepID=A0A9P8AEF5_9AGAR|nr:uncharacterized protein E1B28_000721 [Marasmius oreades]KAG7098816.1 hypothetical protein E1B28_000721 [Marasmius oreades]